MKYTTRHITIHARGFTLVETLVSIFIITIAIVGPLTVATNASAYGKLTKDTMIAKYLAQEAVELLHHQQDSVYIRCADQESSKCLSSDEEYPSETAWRTFKERLGSNVQGASCFTTDNPAGCSYDFVDMTKNEDSNPSKYVATAASCDTLSYDQALHMYMCTGVRGTGLLQTNFSRIIKITPVGTFDGAGASAYNDDLRVDVIVTFRHPNGRIQQIKVVDFLHARA